MDSADSLATRSDLPEHTIFKSLQSHQDRLKKKLSYQPIDLEFENKTPAVTRIALKQLEQILREILATVNIDDDLRLKSMSKANNTLKSLCSALESVVNSDLFPLDSKNWAHPHDQYPRLMTLVNVLESQSWDFDLISGAQVGSRTLFKVKSDDMVGKLDTAANEFNTCVRNIYQRPLQEIEPTRKLSYNVDGIEKARGLINSLRNSLEKLLCCLSQNKKCQGTHQVMVQLSDSSIESRTNFPLFLSRCSSNVWLETQLESPPSGNDQDWETYQDVCAMIQESDSDRGILFIATKDEDKDEDLYLFNPVSTRTRSASYPLKKPTTTLSDLLDDHAFYEGPRNRWLETKNPFCEQQKRSLAAKLILGLGHIWASRYILKSWNPGEVYFLTNLDGICLPDIPYALCDVADNEGFDESTRFSDEQMLAKVLMEIEYGSPKKISSPAELQIIINQCLTDDLRRRDYIDVVQDLLDFHRDTKRLARRINAMENDYSTLARMVIAQRLADRIINISQQDRTARDKRFSNPRYNALCISPLDISHDSPELHNLTVRADKQDSSREDNSLQESMQWFQGLSKLAYVLEMKWHKLDDVALKIKIAILDTGLDEKYRNKHPQEQFHDFLSPTERSCQDLAGHGTQMYQVLRRVYSEAEIYVGRVFETCAANLETANLMAQAIDYAVNVWDVDIIAMPSGFENDHRGMLNQMTKSISNDKPVLFFAAAANSSNMKRVAFPARLHRRLRVISMFSTTAKNKPTPDFHPAPDKKSLFNLAIFGEHVVVNKAKISGTSVSTIIGAGLAGRLLAFAHNPVNSGKILHVEYLRDTEGMSTVLKSMAIHENGYDCILPEKLLDGYYDRGAEDYSERLVDYVCGRIGSALDRALHH
ncbi:hypothetical protein F4806DRAFT_90486 [Annulohypoxylon nitens]|nr:hypothetical protein F4806DRAFT_90486 [Annulohypoxylon nitens]